METRPMDTLEKLKQTPPGPARVKAAHDLAVKETAKRDQARADQIMACLVLTQKHEWSQAKAARAAKVSVQNLFGSGTAATVKVAEQLPNLPNWDEAKATAELESAVAQYAEAKATAKDTVQIRRDGIVALYTGAHDGRLWEPADIADATDVPDYLVRADLKAARVTMRPLRGKNVATPGGPPAKLADIARMLRVRFETLRSAVRAASRPEKAGKPGAFPMDAIDPDTGLYRPAVVKTWWETRPRPRAAYAPQGESLRRLAEQIGESYEKVKAAVRTARLDGALPGGVVHDDETYNPEAFVTWWREREKAMNAGVTLVQLAFELSEDVERVRGRVRWARDKDRFPDGIRLDNGRYDREAFKAWWTEQQ